MDNNDKSILSPPVDNVDARSDDQQIQSVLMLPEGTQIAQQGNAIEFQLPSGYHLIGTTTTGDVQRVSGGKWTCTCVSGDGACIAFETDDTVGCSTEKENLCTDCRGKASVTIQSEITLDQFFIQLPEDSGGPGPMSTVGPVTDFEAWLQAPWITDALYSQYEVRLQSVLDTLWNGLDTESTPAVPVLWYAENSKLLMYLPYHLLEPENIYGIDDGDDTRTYCSGCAGSCVLKYKAMRQIRYCDGCDSGCSIHW